MLIVCPNCATAYQVDLTTLGPEGRRVRCARCQSVWLASPADAQPIPVDSGRTPSPAAPTRAARAPADAAEAADIASTAPSPAVPVAIAQAPSLVPAIDPNGINADDDRTIDVRGEDIETVAARRDHRRPRRGIGPRGRWRLPRLSTLIVTLAGCLVALVAGRAAVVRTFPQTASLFAAIHLPVNLRGLDFADVKSSQEFDAGVPVLVVDGKIVNQTNRILDVPRLRIAVRNAAGNEVYAWTALAQNPILGPRDSLPFRTRLASPPSDAKDVIVRFFSKRDRIAGFH
jgi:predicted Zn finger-like uncharacterized protein